MPWIEAVGGGGRGGRRVWVWEAWSAQGRQVPFCQSPKAAQMAGGARPTSASSHWPRADSHGRAVVSFRRPLRVKKIGRRRRPRGDAVCRRERSRVGRAREEKRGAGGRLPNLAMMMRDKLCKG